MSYSTDKAELLTKQLQRFATLNKHQLAGQAANVEFWMAEIKSCLSAIDDYGERFKALRNAQNAYVAAHGTVEFYPDDPWIQSSPDPPRHVPDRELRDARQALCYAAKTFLRRCLDDGFVEIVNYDDFIAAVEPK